MNALNNGSMSRLCRPVAGSFCVLSCGVLAQAGELVAPVKVKAGGVPIDVRIDQNGVAVESRPQENPSGQER